MIAYKNTELEIRRSLRLEILAVTGLPNSGVIFGVRDQATSKPVVSIYELSGVSSEDTHDEDARLNESIFQLTISARLPSEAATIFDSIRRGMNNKGIPPFQRIEVRRLSSFAEPDENIHNTIAEVKVLYNLSD